MPEIISCTVLAITATVIITLSAREMAEGRPVADLQPRRLRRTFAPKGAGGKRSPGSKSKPSHVLRCKQPQDSQREVSQIRQKKPSFFGRFRKPTARSPKSDSSSDSNSSFSDESCNERPRGPKPSQVLLPNLEYKYTWLGWKRVQSIRTTAAVEISADDSSDSGSSSDNSDSTDSKESSHDAHPRLARFLKSAKLKRASRQRTEQMRKELEIKYAEEQEQKRSQQREIAVNNWLQDIDLAEGGCDGSSRPAKCLYSECDAETVADMELQIGELALHRCCSRS